MAKRIADMTTDDFQVVDQVLADADVARSTRGQILKQGMLAAAVGAGVLGTAGTARAAHGTSDSVAEIGRAAVTAEALAVTYLYQVLTRMPQRGEAFGLPAKTVGNILRAANKTEAEHYDLLHSPMGRGMGFQPLTLRFWIPDAAFGPNLSNVPKTLEAAEGLFVNAYAVAIPVFARAGLHTEAMYAGQILGTEAQHLALARFLQGELPNNVAFMPAPLATVEAHIAALQKAGFGFGERGATPGRFYEYGGPGSQTTKIGQLQP